MNRETLFKKAYLALLCLIAVTLPTKWIRLNSIAIVCLGILYIFDKGLLERLKRLFKSYLFISTSLIYLLYALSLFYSQNLQKGFSNLETRVPLLLFPLILLSYYNLEKKEINAVLISFLSSCLFFSGLCLISTFYNNYKDGIEYVYYNSWYFSADSLIMNFGFHTSFFSIYCSFCIFIIIYFYKEKLLKSNPTLLIIAYLIMFQLLLASRSGLLATLILLMGTILYEAHTHKKLWIGFASILIIGICMTFALLQFTAITEKFKGMFNYEIDELNERFKLTSRFEKWESAIVLYQRHPLLGAGIGDSRDELREIYKEKGFEEAYTLNYDAHNLFLETATSIGIPGILAVILLFYTSFKICYKNRDALYFQFILLFFLFSIVQAAFSVQKGVVFFAFFNTLFLAYYLTSKNKLNSSLHVSKSQHFILIKSFFLGSK